MSLTIWWMNHINLELRRTIIVGFRFTVGKWKFKSIVIICNIIRDLSSSKQTTFSRCHFNMFITRWIFFSFIMHVFLISYCSFHCSSKHETTHSNLSLYLSCSFVIFESKATASQSSLWYFCKTYINTWPWKCENRHIMLFVGYLLDAWKEPLKETWWW